MALYIKPYLVDNEKGRVFIVHGICEHRGRYESLAKSLNNAKYSVITYDLRGHGKSEGKKGYIKSFTEHVNDLSYVVDKYKNNQVKQFLIGHSMGGLIGHLYMIGDPKVDGYIASGAPTDYLKKVKPIRYFGYKWFGFLNVHNKFGHQTLTHDEIIEKYYQRDPLTLKKYKVRLAGEMFVSGVKYLNKHLYRNEKPVLILHGGADSIVPVEHSKRIYNLLSTHDKTLKIYESNYHEIFNELNKEEVIGDCVRWLNEH